MGYDPFWPTCLASINVLCVPASAIAPERLQHTIDALATCAHIELAAVEGEDLNDDLINAAKFTKGSAFFDFSAQLSCPGIQRSPFEINALPQVVLGIYDYQESDDDLATSALHERLSNASFPVQRNCVYALIALGRPSEASDSSVIGLPDFEHESISRVVQTLYKLVWKSFKDLGRVLSDVSFVDPVALPVPSSDGLNSATDGVPQVPSQEVRKGRHIFCLGLLNLQLGAWPDALRRLSEAALLSRETEDSLWQARALESLLVCMLLFAWCGLDFDMPDVCEKAYSTSQAMSRLSIFGRPASVALIAQSKDNTISTPVRKWAKYSPVIAQVILSTYTALASSLERTVPPQLLAESRVRIVNLLIFSSNELSPTRKDEFNTFLLDRKHPVGLASSSTYAASTSLGASIPNLLLSIVPSADDTYLEPEELSLVVAVVSALTALGSLRRYAFFLRGILQRLRNTLAKARKLGASEAGIHPESSLSIATASSASQGLRSLLDAATSAYGVRTSLPELPDALPRSSQSSIEQALLSWCEHHLDGDLSLKLEILRLCIRVCDAQPDLDGSAGYTSAMLRLAVGSPTISASTSNTPPGLPANEQSRLLEGLRRTVELAQKLGEPTNTPYWDNFLVRDVTVMQTNNGAGLIPHAPSELSLADSQSGTQDRDPFIFNPFARNTTIQAAPVVVAGELVTFSVSLQNPLEVEIDVNDITLEAEGMDFIPSHHSVVLGPFCAQSFRLTGTAQAKGSLKIIGCTASIEGCRPEVFPALKNDWRPPLKVKQKMSNKLRDRSAMFTTAELNIPEPSTLSLKVIDPQPQLEIVSSSLAQPSVMLLEGEKQTVTVEVRNASPTVPADFILLSSNDSVSKSLRETLSRKDLLPVDTYEVQHQLKHRPVVELSGKEQSTNHTEPGEVVSYHFDIWGRPGLTEAAVHFDFAYLGKPHSEIQETFYTRQIRFLLACTVNGSIDVVRCNVLPVHGQLHLGKLEDGNERGDTKISKAFAVDETAPDGACLLSIDLRNVWPQPLTVELKSRRTLEPDSKDDPLYTASETIQPGHVSRVMLLVPRLFVQNATAPIPSLETQRQFVVSASKMSLEAETTTRENFWFREELLRHISGTWTDERSGRHGEIDLRKGLRLNLNARMIQHLRVDHVDVSFSLVPNQHSESAVREIEHEHYELQTEQFALVKVHVHNRSTERLELLLRLQPCLRDQPHSIALDLSRRLAWSGVLQQVLHPPLAPDEQRTIELGLVIFSKGLYDVNATVEEVRRNTSKDQASVEAPRRRIWHAQSPCQIDAIEMAL
jgi:trafficking protein particle complex subunit 9